MPSNSKEYREKYYKNRYYKIKLQIFDYLGNKCVECSSTEDLEIDHINWYEKSFTVTSYTNLSFETIKKELEKCQLLCKKCHIEKTKEDACEQITGYREVQHGTYWRYKKYNCRCEKCTISFKEGCRKYKKSVRRLKKAEHGSRVMYNYHKCRCNICKQANTHRMREYNKKKREEKSMGR